MKKSYLMIAAAVALLTACSSNDSFKDVDTQDAVIGFGHSATEKTTRAELDMTWFRTIDNGFGVYGYKVDAPIFKNENVYCASTTETVSGSVTSPYRWDHATIRFWDKAANDAYDFYAYAPFTGTNNVVGTNPTFSKSTGFTFTGIPVIADIDDLGADKAVANAVENIDYNDGRLHNAHTNSPTVQFVFNHILSKLSFKIKTDIPAHNASSNPTATFTVKKVEIDFPSATGVQWAETSSDAPAGKTTYTDYAAKDGTYDFTVFEGSQTVTNSAVALTNGMTFIVTPVNSETTVTKHEFEVKVTYDILYADNTTETGCIATGTIGTGTPATNTYTPAQNQYYIAVININPEKIEFCVEDVNAWDPITETDPVDVK
jgi:hypothetical protein